MKIGNTMLIPQNIAPPKATSLAIFDGSTKVATIDIAKMQRTNLGEKQYSVLLISDVHIPYDTATSDFNKALTYADNDEDIAFTCISGDLTSAGTAAQLTEYKAIVDSHTKPVYAISGNHEASEGAISFEALEPYTGYPLYYSFEHNGDVYIMLGQHKWTQLPFEENELQWLYETLEANRNKRCFVFYHMFPWGDCGNADGLYKENFFVASYQAVFQSLLRHYKNTTLFHGHSHLKLYLQELDERANFSNAQGYRSIHIPSLAAPRDDANRDGTYENVFAESEGYIMEVYENCIVLKGYDFIDDEHIPIAQYCIDTTLQTVEANTFTSSTGA